MGQLQRTRRHRPRSTVECKVTDKLPRAVVVFITHQQTPQPYLEEFAEALLMLPPQKGLAQGDGRGFPFTVPFVPLELCVMSLGSLGKELINQLIHVNTNF